jgi:hypothetical protein
MADRIDILLKEYETCQSHNNAIGTQFWAVIGIVLSLSTVLLGGVAYIVVSVSSNESPSQHVKWLVLVLGIVIIIILLLVMFWLKRLQFMTLLNNERMREIENEVKINEKVVMWKNWRVYGLDLKYRSIKDFKRLSQERKEFVNKLSDCYPKDCWWFIKSIKKYVPPIGSIVVKIMFAFVGGMWLFFVIWSWIILNQS